MSSLYWFGVFMLKLCFFGSYPWKYYMYPFNLLNFPYKNTFFITPDMLLLF